MTRKIALEEHFMAPQFITYFKSTAVNISADLFDKAVGALSDFGERRIAAMHHNEISHAILSLSGPGVQIEKETRTAVRLARECNDFLAERIQLNPKRYGGFAHLALQDANEAAAELERCVRDLGFHGAMINGQTGGLYLDDPSYFAFWERAEALNAPIYIHPGNPVDKPAMYDGHPELWGPVWSWGVETASHALRLVFSGLFDRFPKATLILGHMGEALPFQLWRFDSRWEISNRGAMRLALSPSEYFRRNVVVTTSGVCSPEPLLCALQALGHERVLFSVDYPFERSDIAAKFIETAPIPDDVRRLICHKNAESLFNLGG
ncbi:MAG: amidohydrolase [Bradyrhizobium sp.]|uniref:amidohydrolase family protein n=1 Tax=Bradyrhizobium sp. TaxID=376 RepID=UPI001D4FAD0B|nr:amidohydrolase family protein [Bradyrhizobium sp.]MBV9564578.1 amidohydrolase [Bradyrhizobium sp.]